MKRSFIFRRHFILVEKNYNFWDIFFRLGDVSKEQDNIFSSSFLHLVFFIRFGLSIISHYTFFFLNFMLQNLFRGMLLRSELVHGWFLRTYNTRAAVLVSFQNMYDVICLLKFLFSFQNNKKVYIFFSFSDNVCFKWHLHPFIRCCFFCFTPSFNLEKWTKKISLQKAKFSQ